MITFGDDTIVQDIYGGLSGLIPRDYSVQPLGSLPYTSPFSEAVSIIPESEWPDRIKAMQGRFARHVYTGTPTEDFQNGLKFCWSFSLTQDVKCARDRAGLPHVDLLAESLGGAVNWRNKGNYCGAAIKYASEHGICDRSFSPKRYDLDPSTWKSGWEAEALNHKPLEWWELGQQNMRLETGTALLLGYSVYVGFNWASHAMSLQELQFDGSKFSVWTPNTHGSGQDWLLSGSRMIPDEAYVVRVCTWS